MLVILRPGTTEDEVQRAGALLREMCEAVDVSRGIMQTVIGLIGSEEGIDPDHIVAVLGDVVARVVPVQERYKMAALGPRQGHSVVNVGAVPFGNGHIGMIGGPCAVESLELLRETAWSVVESGAYVLRGDFVKARTDPYSWRGLGEEALGYLAQVSAETGLPFVVDVLSTRDIELALAYGAACLRIGTRYMYDTELLEAAGSQHEASVMIKRGFSATLAEWLLAAEYVMRCGNANVILCARGIRTHEDETRNTPDIASVATLRLMTHLPVIGDPSHSVGRRDLVGPIAAAYMAAGASGLMVDVHPWPAEAQVDGAQALLPSDFAALMRELRQPVGAMA